MLKNGMVGTIVGLLCEEGVFLPILAGIPPFFVPPLHAVVDCVGAIPYHIILLQHPTHTNGRH